jgi:hypothetical protein
MSCHVALLGDSSFDNRSYTRGQPDVAGHLREVLGTGSRVTLLAIDGATTTDMGAQLDRVRDDMTQLVLSVGGNDALLNAGLLDVRVRSTAEALDLFGAAVDVFEENHRYVTEALAALRRELIVCTIYNGNLSAPEGPRARVALRMFNDAIARSARHAQARLIDLRDVCCASEDYANPIEPSGIGGRKIAEAIARLVDASIA